MITMIKSFLAALLLCPFFFSCQPHRRIFLEKDVHPFEFNAVKVEAKAKDRVEFTAKDAISIEVINMVTSEKARVRTILKNLSPNTVLFCNHECEGEDKGAELTISCCMGLRLEEYEPFIILNSGESLTIDNEYQENAISFNFIGVIINDVSKFKKHVPSDFEWVYNGKGKTKEFNIALNEMPEDGMIYILLENFPLNGKETVTTFELGEY